MHKLIDLAWQTTYENFRYRYDNKQNPYNQGPFRNFKSILCSRIPHSQNNFRAKIQEAAPSNAAPAMQSRESVDVLSPNRKAVDDTEMGEKSPWSSMVSGEYSYSE